MVIRVLQDLHNKDFQVLRAAARVAPEAEAAVAAHLKQEDRILAQIKAVKGEMVPHILLLAQMCYMRVAVVADLILVQEIQRTLDAAAPAVVAMAA